MKTYYIYFMKCSYTSEMYVKAISAAEAEKKFREAKSAATILSISEVKGETL